MKPQDKGRLEINFIIPNVELSTGKRLQPYFDQADRPLVENWKQVTNFEHGLSDPHAPDKAQAIKVLNSQNLPESVKEIKQQIGTVIAEQISKGNIQNRQDVVKTLEGAGFDITRQTDKSISIKNPDGKRNIRLEGVIYENRRFGEEFRAEHSRAGQDYQETSRERYQTALGKLQRLTTKKLEANREHFREKPSNHRGATAEHSKRFAFEYTQGGSFGRTGGDISDISRDNGMARQGNQSQATGISRNQPRAGKNTIRESDIAYGGISRERGQQSLFHRSEERQESGSVHNNGQGQGTQNREVGNEHDQRLYESLQRHFELVREAIERAKRNKSKTDQADRNIEQSESRISESKRAIDQSQQCYNHS
ncbi:relaxase/mobilization nuclease domain-containing protein, partial [Acinetobacter sp. YH16052]|uniref:relaxase/mobilization nuclease domain-containing protein n=1 Tax=Acinetobacter sp. YH16052 TaxID=2601191 RepID=UPI00211E899B